MVRSSDINSLFFVRGDVRRKANGNATLLGAGGCGLGDERRAMSADAMGVKRGKIAESPPSR